jgi:CBS domain-containing protein
MASFSKMSVFPNVFNRFPHETTHFAKQDIKEHVKFSNPKAALKLHQMRKPSSITGLLTTNCLTVDPAVDVQLIRDIFNRYPIPFIPVVDGLRFVGVIFREDFLRRNIEWSDQTLCPSDFISKEIITLSVHNSPEQAAGVFEANVFDLIPVVDEVGDLMGLLLRDDLEQHLENRDEEAILSPTFRKIRSFLSL